MGLIKTIRENVNKEEIIKYYLTGEMGTIVDKVDDELFWKFVEESFQNKTSDQLWRLLESFSGAYRLNGVFSWLSSDAYRWNLEEWSIDSIDLTRVNPAVNKILEKVDYNLTDFVTYLRESPNALPQGKGQLNREVRFPTLIGWEGEGRINILDGFNRVVSLLFQGEKSVQLYVAYRIKPKEEETKLVARYPIYVLWWLARKSYQQDQSAFDAVIAILQYMKGRFRKFDEIISECLAHQPDDKATQIVAEKVLTTTL